MGQISSTQILDVQDGGVEDIPFSEFPQEIKSEAEQMAKLLFQKMDGLERKLENNELKRQSDYADLKNRMEEMVEMLKVKENAGQEEAETSSKVWAKATGCDTNCVREHGTGTASAVEQKDGIRPYLAKSPKHETAENDVISDEPIRENITMEDDAESKTDIQLGCYLATEALDAGKGNLTEDQDGAQNRGRKLSKGVNTTSLDEECSNTLIEGGGGIQRHANAEHAICKASGRKPEMPTTYRPTIKRPVRRNLSNPTLRTLKDNSGPAMKSTDKSKKRRSRRQKSLSVPADEDEPAEYKDFNQRCLSMALQARFEFILNSVPHEEGKLPACMKLDYIRNKRDRIEIEKPVETRRKFIIYLIKLMDQSFDVIKRWVTRELEKDIREQIFQTLEEHKKVIFRDQMCWFCQLQANVPITEIAEPFFGSTIISRGLMQRITESKPLHNKRKLYEELAKECRQFRIHKKIYKVMEEALAKHIQKSSESNLLPTLNSLKDAFNTIADSEDLLVCRCKELLAMQNQPQLSHAKLFYFEMSPEEIATTSESSSNKEQTSNSDEEEYQIVDHDNIAILSSTTQDPAVSNKTMTSTRENQKTETQRSDDIESDPNIPQNGEDKTSKSSHKERASRTARNKVMFAGSRIKAKSVTFAQTVYMCDKHESEGLEKEDDKNKDNRIPSAAMKGKYETSQPMSAHMESDTTATATRQEEEQEEEEEEHKMNYLSDVSYEQEEKQSTMGCPSEGYVGLPTVGPIERSPNVDNDMMCTTKENVMDQQSTRTDDQSEEHWKREPNDPANDHLSGVNVEEGQRTCRATGANDLEERVDFDLEIWAPTKVSALENSQIQVEMLKDAQTDDV